MSLGLVASAIKKDRGTRFSGTGYCDFGNASTFNFERTDSFTLYAWARWTQTGTAIILGRESGGGSGRGWALAVNAAGGTTSIRFEIKNTSGGTNSLILDTTVQGWNDGKWHAIVATYAGTSVPSGVHIYVDGTDLALTTTNNNLSATAQSTTAMAAARDINQSAFEFTGDIGSLAVFSGVLGSTDRATLLNTRHPPNKAAVLAISGILGFWRMGNGAVYPTIADETAAHAGTLTSLSAAALQTYAPPYS